MSTVTKCDSCGVVIPQVKGKKIHVYNVNDIGNAGGRCLTMDICPDCYKKVKEVLESNDKQTTNG